MLCLKQIGLIQVRLRLRKQPKNNRRYKKDFCYTHTWFLVFKVIRLKLSFPVSTFCEHIIIKITEQVHSEV